MRLLRSIAVLLSALFIVVVSPLSAAEYVGSKKCKSCHIPQFKSWEKTKMAKAFDLLRPKVRSEAKKKHNLDPDKDYTRDDACLPCHVTGYGQETGFVSEEKTPDLAGVQCEQCHGAGSEYLKPGGMTFTNKNYKLADLVKKGLIVPKKETCVTLCHNEKSPFILEDYTFDFKRRQQLGVHDHLPLKYKHD